MSYDPEGDVEITDGRLETKKPWKDADSLENYAPARTWSSGYKGLIRDVALGRLRLPPSLEILQLDIYLSPHYSLAFEKPPRDFYSFEPFNFWVAQRVVYALAKRYPHLRQIHIGWERCKWLWVKPHGE